VAGRSWNIVSVVVQNHVTEVVLEVNSYVSSTLGEGGKSMQGSEEGRRLNLLWGRGRGVILQRGSLTDDVRSPRRPALPK